MIDYEQRLSLTEFLYKKPDVHLPELAEDLLILTSPLRDIFDDLLRSQIESRKQAAALQARNRELETYVYMVAHDLKDPLNTMIMTSGLIANIPDLPREELKEYLQLIKSTAYNMNTIINSLLLFAEVSQAEAPVERVNMSQVVANVQKRLSYIIKENRAQIVLPESWPDSSGYAPWVEEVWANYLSNAIKHGGQPPHVELGASLQPDGMIRFWARDNGPGLPPHLRAELFTPFSQISRICSPGHGLGLSIALHIVEKMGGQVGVESELGQGSLFFFTLPGSPAAS